MPKMLDSWTKEDWNLDNQVKIGFKRLHTNARIPSKATAGSAGFDCYLPETVQPISAGEIRIVKLGFALEIPEGYCVRIVARSGLASRGLLVANAPAVLDADFKGEIGVILWSVSGIFPLNAGDRICQMTIEKVPDVVFEPVDELSESERGEGGYGSTGQ